MSDKAPRVHLYHRDTIHAFLELIASNGLASPAEIRPGNVHRRVSATGIRNFAEVYEYLPTGSFLDGARVPDEWADRWTRSSAQRF